MKLKVTQFSLKAVGLLVSLCLVLFAGTTLACAGGAGATKAGAAATDPSGKPVVSWDKAMDYIGQEVVVEGTVVSTADKGPIFINFHSDFRHTFSIFVPPSNKDALKAAITGFPGVLEGKKVRIRGIVKKFEKDGDAKPEIELTSADQLTIM